MLTVQKKTFSLAGMSPKSSNMTAKSGINTADTSKVYHLLVVGTDALTIPEISGDDISIEKVSGCARKYLVVDDVFRSCSDSTKTFVHVRDVNEMSAMYCASGASNTEFSESIKKSLPLCGNTVYGYKAPHKTGAGILNLLTNEAHNRASGFFVRTVLPRLFRVRIMAGRTGPTSVGPDSLLSGVENPVRLATPRFSTLDGELFLSPSKEATPWQTANSTALSRSVVTSRLKSTADFPAHHASRKSCTSICCMSVAANFQTSTHPLFSAIWRMICASFNSSSSSKTNSINSCSGPFLHLAAGGLRTSVTRGLPQ